MLSLKRPAQRPQVDLHNQDYIRSFTAYLREHYLTGFEPEYLESEAFQHDVNEHVYRRAERFTDHLAPWVGSAFDLSDATVLEVGSGTGSSTLAFAPLAKHIHTYEIDEKATRAAQFRLKHFGVDNVSFENEIFAPQAKFVSDGKKADVVLLVATLEHMYYEELETVLKTAYAVLRPGGVMVIAETPNRLCPFDYHSSWMYFYQWLPPAVRERYYDRSPRPHFVADVKSVRNNNVFGTDERLTRWGNGISFHDFELALGADVHQWIIADGWEDQVRPLAPIFKDDEILLHMFEKLEIKANKAFARSWLYFIIRKPLVS